MTANDLLTRIADGEIPRGIPDKWEWRWDIRGENCTRAVNTLRKRGLIDVTYYRNFASVNLAL